MGVILETDADRELELVTIRRLLGIAKSGSTAVQLPLLSAVDYLIQRDGVVTAGIEIKTRKETVEKIQSYGGLMLKHRKFLELRELSTLLQAPMFVAFAFENGNGPILTVEPMKIHDPEPVIPPPRKNFRGLPCDEEPVIFLDWSRDLTRLL